MGKNHLQAWEDLYSSSKHLSIWPWTDVVTLVMKYAKPQPGRKIRVLELGCGAGANIPFFSSIGADYWAIEGSSSVVAQLREAFPQFARTIAVGDFTKDLDFDVEFDLIVDRGSVTHNSTTDIRATLNACKGLLCATGKFIGIDWFSTEFDEYQNGKPGEDKYTKQNFKVGRLNGIELAHFCDQAHLQELLSGFDLHHMEHKTVTQYIPSGRGHYAAWNFVISAVT